MPAFVTRRIEPDKNHLFCQTPCKLRLLFVNGSKPPGSSARWLTIVDTVFQNLCHTPRKVIRQRIAVIDSKKFGITYPPDPFTQEVEICPMVRNMLIRFLHNLPDVIVCPKPNRFPVRMIRYRAQGRRAGRQCPPFPLAPH